MKRLQTSIAIFLLVVLTGCGFHLRGQVNLPPIMASPWVTGQDNQLVTDLRSLLRESGVNPVKDAGSASVIIDLATVDYVRTVKSVDSNGTATGYILQYKVLYRVVDPTGKVLVGNTPLSFSRELTYSSVDLLQKKQEEEALKESMRAEVTRRILRRLDGIAFHAPAGDAMYGRVV
ncbi:MAG: LPS assembly lipoprotein LptE [Arenicellales bacterium]